MKTSDKLLLILLLSALGIFGAVHLALYARYRQGNFLGEKELNEQGFIKYRGPAPVALSLKGNMIVRIIPSDNFSVEIEKDGGGPGQDGGLNGPKAVIEGVEAAGSRKLSYHADGDTLIIRGNPFPEIDPHGAWQSYFNFPRVNIYAGQLKSIRVSGGMVDLKGEERPGQFHTALFFRNALCWIGESDENYNWKWSPAYYDSVRIQADNSKLVLHANATIKKLTVQLDDGSEIDELKARVDHSSIACSANSRINMTGATLKNLRLPGGLSPPDH
jgi:hypothetical protein